MSTKGPGSRGRTASNTPAKNGKAPKASKDTAAATPRKRTTARPKTNSAANKANKANKATPTATAARTPLFNAVPNPNKVDYALLEGEVQRWWDEQGILQKYLHRNDNADRRWSFIDGPITANNPMGVHHAWGRTYKDLWQRFNTMRGYKQRYQNGFDCQGLWVEVEVEKELGFTNKQQIEEYGIANFVDQCKRRVLRYASEITRQSVRLGEWMEWDNSYLTMSDENNYTIWGFLKKCWQEGWIYRGHDVMPWCPRCATGISDMEINEGRAEVQHTSVYVRFPLVDRPGEYLLVWTTTPWTLPANVAAAVNPELTYAKVEQDGDFYYLSRDIVPRLSKLRGHEHGEARVVEELPGRDLVGWEYVGPFDELPAWEKVGARHRVVAWDEVAATEGTGIVHIAPGCGREDFALGQEEHLAVLAPVDDTGVYLGGYDWLTGMAVGEVARPIFENLRQKGYFYQTETIQHVYPHCWRCKTELIFRLVDEWFISMRELRPRLIRITQNIRWIPSFGLERELDWLRNMEDWMISKKRYWGLALPIWVCEQCDAWEVIGGREELQERAATGWEVFDGHTPHRPYVDAVTVKCPKCGGEARRVPDVGNPWLDAGIVPLSTLHYHDDKDYWREWFPADFITESFPGQFRNWFYSMLVMAAAMEDAEPFKNVLGFATLQDQDGNGMHKSLGNSIPFDVAAEIVGADTMRWLYMSQAPEQNLRFPRLSNAKNVKEDVAVAQVNAEAARANGQPPRLPDLWMQVRGPLDKLWNVYSFFVTYANIDHFNPAAHRLPAAERSDLDRWVLSDLQETIRTTTERLADFDAEHATEAIATFVEHLSNWYVRRSRRRFWKTEEDADKVAAYLTLYECLVTVTKLLAPITPFLAESLYQNLVRRADATAPESVHLADWPVVDEALINKALEDETALVMRLVNLGRAVREQAKIRVRQPVSTLYVRVANEAEANALGRLGSQVREELNLKRLELLPAESDMLLYALKPNMKALGPRLGKAAPKVAAAVRAADAQSAAVALRETGTLRLEVDGEEVFLTPEEVEIEASAKEGFVAAEERGYVAVLETTLTPELLAEGLMRDLTHLIQDVRKHADLAIEDTIDTWVVTDAELGATVEQFAEYVKDETLTKQLVILIGAPEDAVPADGFTETIPAAKLGGHEARVTVRKRA